MQPLSWQDQLSNAIRHPQSLLDYVDLDAEDLGYSKQGIEQFPVLVPHAFATRIIKGCPDDPILRQVFPYIEESMPANGFSIDPLQEENVQRLPGLLQKYPGRVLTISTGACAVHCRYCFRRHYPYQSASITQSNWQDSLHLISQDKTLQEVILSGGDPLMLSDKKLITMLHELSSIAHVKRIRLHTRIPVVLPARITDVLLNHLKKSQTTIIIVLHINHANEIDNAVKEKILQLHQSHVQLFNQSVLLKGINDDVETLIKLSEHLINIKITPYYLHLLDPVIGTAHYQVGEIKASDLIKSMQERVSGYLVPRLVKEIPDQMSKTPIF